ncbi:MAG: hypothetical protein IT384_30750 [Deltaproteobacteria bacterium]|nr:hypothetical protein [Deltaproteobacteria bacterium]
MAERVFSSLLLASALSAVAPPASAQAPDEPGGPRLTEGGPASGGLGERAFRLGLINDFTMGIGGQLDNPSPAYRFAVDFAFPSGRAMRYHVLVGFQNLNGYDGVYFAPLTFGYEIPIRQKFLPPGVNMEVELVLLLLQAEAIFSDEYSISLSSGFRPQLLLTYDMGYLALTFIGFEVRYAYGVGDVGIKTGAGVNWPIHIALGVEL